MLPSSVGYTPIFQVLKGGIDLTSKLQDRLLEATYHGYSNSEISRIELTFDDRDFALDPPTGGDKITFRLGYKEYGMADFGEFSIEEVTFSGPPYSMHVTGFGVSINSLMKAPEISSFGDMSAQQIMEQVGAMAGVQIKVAPELGKVMIPFLNQTGQSGFGLIDTLTRRLGGTAVFQNQTVSIVKRGSGQSAGGQSLSSTNLTLEDLASYSVKINTRSDFGGTSSSHWDPEKLERVFVDKEATFERTAFAGAGAIGKFIVGGMHTSKDEAEKAAEAKNDTFGRTQARIEVTLAKGDPFITPQSPLKISGVRSGVDGGYTVENVKHVYSRQVGISTTIEGYTGSGGSEGGGDSGGSGGGGGGGDTGTTST